MNRSIVSGSAIAPWRLEHSIERQDPGEGFCESWEKRFEALEIAHLRSPAFAHPSAYDAHALMNFAIDHGTAGVLYHGTIECPIECLTGRTEEISAVPASEMESWAAGDLTRTAMLHGLPSRALFRDFCASLAAKHPHQWHKDWATQIIKDDATGKYQVHAASGQTVTADAVVLALGPQGMPNVPSAFRPHVDGRLVLHTEELFRRGGVNPMWINAAVPTQCNRLSNRHF